jgi:TonB family protein
VRSKKAKSTGAARRGSKGTAMTGEPPTRALKFGLVQDGKLIDEGILHGKEGVTVGSDTTATINVSDPNMPKRLRLIEPHGSGYRLTFQKGITGQVSIGDQVMSLEQLAQSQNSVKKGDTTEVVLNVSAKGRLDVGASSILFQFIPSPTLAPIQKLPKEYRSRPFSEFDIFFVVIVLVSALFHLSMVTYLNSLEVTDSLTSDETARFAKRLVTTEDIVLVEDEMEDEELDTKKKPGGGGQKGGGAEEDKGVESKGLLALITKHGGSGSVADILSEGIGDDLTSAISGISGVEVAGKGAGGMKGTRGGDGSGTGAGNSVGVGDIGSVGSKKSVGTGTRMEKKVKSNISGGPGGVSGKIDQASVYSVIRRRLGGVRYCYESQLKTNPSLSGKIRVQFVIGSTGSVGSCSVVSNSMGNAYVQDCVCRMVGRWKFPSPDEGTVTVGYTFIFSSGG